MNLTRIVFPLHLLLLSACHASQMEFTIEPALPSDAARLTEIYFSAFADDFSRRILPPSEDVNAFMTAKFKADAEEAQSGKTSTSLLKVVGTAPDQAPVIAGFALWKFAEDDSPSSETGGTSEVSWPASSDGELCDRFFSGVDWERRQVIGDQPHYYLDMLATDPEFGRRGLGARLLQWGLERADEAGVVTFISASPVGRGLYEKNGCRAVKSYEVIPGYWQTSMVRPVAGMSRG